MFSSEFCEISKDTFFTEHLRWLLLTMEDYQMWKNRKTALKANKLVIHKSQGKHLLNVNNILSVHKLQALKSFWIFPARNKFRLDPSFHRTSTKSRGRNCLTELLIFDELSDECFIADVVSSLKVFSVY